MRTLDRDELKEILSKCWLTHDGLWFYHCMQECGVEKTNKVNSAAARSVGMVEVKRIHQALGGGEIETFDQLKEFMEAFWDVLIADFVQFRRTFPAHNRLHIEMDDCFAYNGIQRMGAIDHYDCGIFARTAAWFDGLGIAYSVTPEIKGCMYDTDGRCFRDFTFTLR